MWEKGVKIQGYCFVILAEFPADLGLDSRGPAIPASPCSC